MTFTKTLKTAAVAATLAIAAMGADAATVNFTMDFGTAASTGNASFTQDGMVLTGGSAFNIVNAGCSSGGCVQMGKGASLTLTRVGGGTFDLTSFFVVVGPNATVTYQTNAMSSPFSYSGNAATGTKTVNLTGITSITFFRTLNSNGANGRLDTLVGSYVTQDAPPPPPPPPVVPLPASAGLLLAGITGLGLARRKAR